MHSDKRPVIEDVRAYVAQRTVDVQLTVANQFDLIPLSEGWFDIVCEGVNQKLDRIEP